MFGINNMAIKKDLTVNRSLFYSGELVTIPENLV